MVSNGLPFSSYWISGNEVKNVSKWALRGRLIQFFQYISIHIPLFLFD